MSGSTTHSPIAVCPRRYVREISEEGYSVGDRWGWRSSLADIDGDACFGGGRRSRVGA